MSTQKENCYLSRVSFLLWTEQSIWRYENPKKKRTLKSKEERKSRCFDYLVRFAAFYIVRFPFTIKTHNFASLNMRGCIVQGIDFINPNNAFYNQLTEMQKTTMEKTCLGYCIKDYTKIYNLEFLFHTLSLIARNNKNTGVIKKKSLD